MRGSVVAFLLVVAHAASTAHARTHTQIDVPLNYDIGALIGEPEYPFPAATSTPIGQLGFDFAGPPDAGNDIWNFDETGSQTLNLTVGVFGVRTFYTMMSTWWGFPGKAGEIEFFFDDGSSHVADINGEEHVREWINDEAELSYTSRVDPSQVMPYVVKTLDAGSARFALFDLQRWIVPAEHHLKTMSHAVITDTGATGTSRMLLAGAFVDTDPLPGRVYETVDISGAANYNFRTTPLGATTPDEYAPVEGVAQYSILDIDFVGAADGAALTGWRADIAGSAAVSVTLASGLSITGARTLYTMCDTGWGNPATTLAGTLTVTASDGFERVLEYNFGSGNIKEWVDRYTTAYEQEVDPQQTGTAIFVRRVSTNSHYHVSIQTFDLGDDFVNRTITTMTLNDPRATSDSRLFFHGVTADVGPVQCPADGAEYPVTDVGTTVVASCGVPGGSVSRACGTDGVWEERVCRGGCGDVEAPTLVSFGGGGANDPLRLSFTTPVRMTGVSWAFVGGASTACDNDGTASDSQWTHSPVAAGTSTACARSHEFSAPLAVALGTCNFEGPITEAGSPGVVFYDTTLEATSTEPAGEVFGTNYTRTTVTSFALRVQLQTEVSVTAGPVDAVPSFPGLVSDGRTLAVVTTQEFNTTTETATLRLRTAVAWPYQLVSVSLTEPDGTGTTGTWDALDVTKRADACPTETVCDQDWDLTLVAGANKCELDGTYLVSFTVACNALFDGSCDAAAGTQTAAVNVTLDSDDFCPQVVEVASITPTLTTYSDSDRTSVSTNYILQTTLFARVDLQIEGGLVTDKVELTGLDIASTCAVGCSDDLKQPLTDDGLGASYDFSYTEDGVTGGSFHDFSFTLAAGTDGSISFDQDATSGQADITLTATVRVTYTDPTGQQRSRDVKASAAVPASGSASVSSSSQFGVSGGASGPTSSSSGASPAVASGTVVAAAAVAALAVLAVAAAVAVRRRRGRRELRQRQRKNQPVTLSSSSSRMVQLDVAPSRPAAGTSGHVATADLAGVQSAYNAVQQ